MANRKLTKKEIASWEKFYAKDLAIIGEFLKQEPGKNYRLYFKDGTQLIAYYHGGSDSDNGLELNDPYYEDLYELDFIVKKIEIKGVELNYNKNDFIALNYHNFFIKFEPYNNVI